MFGCHGIIEVSGKVVAVTNSPVSTAGRIVATATAADGQGRAEVPRSVCSITAEPYPHRRASGNSRRRGGMHPGPAMLGPL